MGKPTDKQKEIAELVKLQAEFWQSTNDIDSPTHNCDIEEDVFVNLKLNGLISDEHAEYLEDALNNILYIIRMNK